MHSLFEWLTGCEKSVALRTLPFINLPRELTFPFKAAITDQKTPSFPVPQTPTCSALRVEPFVVIVVVFSSFHAHSQWNRTFSSGHTCVPRAAVLKLRFNVTFV